MPIELAYARLLVFRCRDTNQLYYHGEVVDEPGEELLKVEVDTDIDAYDRFYLIEDPSKSCRYVVAASSGEDALQELVDNVDVFDLDREDYEDDDDVLRDSNGIPQDTDNVRIKRVNLHAVFMEKVNAHQESGSS